MARYRSLEWRDNIAAGMKAGRDPLAPHQPPSNVRPPRLPAQATWTRYPKLAQQIVDETPPHELVATISIMLKRAHETGAAAMKDRCILAVRRLADRRFHSRKVLALACVEAMRRVPSEGGREPGRFNIGHGGINSFWSGNDGTGKRGGWKRRLAAADADADRPDLLRPALGAGDV